MTVPMGNIDGSELLERLCKVRWGTDIWERGFQFEGHKVAAGTRLERAATEGVIQECAGVIQDAGISGALIGFIEADEPLNPPARIKSDEWSENNFHGWASDLSAGIFRFGDKPMSEHSGKQILFEEGKAEEWLEGLPSPYIMRNPPSADPALLPDRSYISLSEAVTWLVYPKPLNSDELHANQLTDRDHVVQYAEDERDEGETEAKFGKWFAAYLASQIRLEKACGVVRDEMARGDLVGRGQRQSSPFGRLGEPVTIPASMFRLGAALSVEDDGIDVDIQTAIRKGVSFSDAVNWRAVKFKRADLVHQWGGGVAEEGAVPSETTEPNSGARQATRELWSIYDNLSPKEKPPIVKWSQCAARVSSILGETVTDDALRKSITRREGKGRG